MTTGSSRKTSQFTSLGPRASTWAAGLLLLVALAACLVAPFLAIHQVRQPFPGFLIEPNRVISRLIRPGWAGHVLLEQEEWLTWQIDTVDGTPVHRAADLYAALADRRPGDVITYTVTPFSTGKLVRWIPAALAQFPPSDMLLLFWGPYLVALLYLVCGLWIFRARRDEPAGRACAIACAAAALSLSLAFDAFWGQHLVRLWIAGLPLLAAGTAHVGFVFPTPLPIARRAPWIIALPYVLAGGLIAWGETGYALSLPSIVDYLPFWKPAFVFLGGAELFLLGCFLYTARASSSTLVRRQARSVLWGGMLSFLPATAGTAAILMQLDPTPFFPLIYLAVAAFPFTLVFTITRRSLFTMDRALRRGLTNSLLAVLLAAFYIALVYFIGWWTSGFLRPGDPLTLAFLVLLAAFLVSPGQHYLRRFVDRALHQEAVDFRQAVQDFGYSLAQVIDLSELSHLILQRIAEIMDLDKAALYLFDPFSGTYQLYQDRSGIETGSPAFAETDRFIQALRVAHGAVSRSDATDGALGTEEIARVDWLQAVLFLPLMSKSRLVGFINLGPRRSGADYAAEDRALLGALADRAAVAIENARLFAERERRLTELAVLNEIGQAINSARSLEETLETIYHETGRLMDTTNFYIALYDPQNQEVAFPLYIANGQRGAVAARRFGNGMTEHILRTRQPLLIAERVEERLRSLGLDVLGIPAASWLGVPILWEDRAIGVIAIQTTDPDVPYDVEDLNILGAIANQAAVAIENARLYEITDQALARRLQEITVLSEFARTLATVALDPAQVAEQTLGRAVETLQAQAGILIHYDEDQQAFVPLAQLHWPEDPSWQEVWRSLLPDLFTMASGPAIFRADDADARVLPVQGAPIHMLCPLIREDTPLALLHLVLPESAEPDEARRHFLRYLADHAAIALENALLYQQQVQQGAMLDRRARHLAEILNLSIAIRANMDLDQVLQFAVRAVQDTLEFRTVLLSLVDEKEPQRMRRAAAAGVEAELLHRLQAEKLPLKLYQEMMQPEVRVGHSYMFGPQDTEIWEQIHSTQAVYAPLLPLHDRPEWNDPCTILTPLRGTADRLVGVLTVSRPADGRVPGQDTIEILEIIANQAAVAIENARLYQALREAYETKGEFLSLVAHELQVPMGTLWGYMDLLDKEIANVDVNTLRGFLQVLRSNIARLDALVHDLLEVSRAEAGALHMEPVPLDVSEVVLDSIATFRPQIERKGLTLVVDAPLGLAPVLADRDRLAQVLDNLLGNAQKYTPAPGIISIKTRTLRNLKDLNGSGPPQGNIRCPCVMVTVQDTGIGIARAEQKRVFTRFFRSDHPAVRQETGTGLGLYLVRLLVERLGGQVWLESEPGQGSRFSVALPLAETGGGG